MVENSWTPSLAQSSIETIQNLGCVHIAQSFVSACADLYHTNPLECSEHKIITCGKKLAHAEKLVGWQAVYLHACASEMDFELFIPEV